MDKKVAILSSSAPPAVTGGVSSAHFNLCAALRGRGYRARIFTTNDHAAGAASDDIVRFGTPPLLLRGIHTLFFFYRKYLERKERFDYAYHVPHIVETAVGALRAGRAIAKFDPDVLIVPDNGSPGFFINRMPRTKTVFIAHHNPQRFARESLIGTYSKRDADIATVFERRTLRKVDTVICPSDYMRDFFRSTYDFPGAVEVIPNLVETETIAAAEPLNIREILSLPASAPVVYIPSAGSHVKGGRYVFEIIRRLSGRFQGAIGFYLSGEIDSPVQKREMEFLPPNARIFAPGRVDYHENLSVIKGCSFCVSPTLLENFSMALLEAALCGLPVVTFDVGGNREIVSDGENGFVVPLLDIEGLLDRCEMLLRSDIGTFSEKALRFARSKFDPESVVDHYIKVLF